MASRESRRLFAALVLAAALVSGAARSDRLAPGDHEIRVEHGGRTRRALVHLPPAAAGDAPLPVWISFHGGGGNAEQHREWIGLDRVADREGFVAVYPFGTGRLSDDKLLTWNADTCCGYAAREAVDDVGAIFALLAVLAGRAHLDATRVYASGMSNGAMLAFRLAHDASERVAAIVTVAGVAKLSPFGAPRPVPILHFHSADDPRAPFDGGLGPRFPFGTRVRHAPVAAVLDEWVVANACPRHPLGGEQQRGAAGSADAGKSAARFEYAPCASGAPVVLWKLSGAGHVWPGAAKLRRGQALLGAPTALVDANELGWEFAKRFSRAEAPPLTSPPASNPSAGL